MVKTEFSIKDLENLSSVKAHTIRIWEKRYHLLEPDRTDTNIRKYDLESLKKLLNITYLYKSGHKISKLADMSPVQIQDLIKKDMETHAAAYSLEILKSAMLEFDGEQFDATIESLLKKKSFSQIFSKILVPLLNNAGILWHTGTIDPSHEHFISEKIKHCLILHTARAKKESEEKEAPFFVLYLPSEEMHEIGLLYANYKLVSNGYPTLYLGSNIPIESLKHVSKQKPNAIFVSYFTVHPETDNLKTYVNSFRENVGERNELWLLGKRGGKYDNGEENIKLFEDIESFNTHLEEIS